jgi:hypothetical protein
MPRNGNETTKNFLESKTGDGEKITLNPFVQPNADGIGDT